MTSSFQTALKSWPWSAASRMFRQLIRSESSSWSSNLNRTIGAVDPMWMSRFNWWRFSSAFSSWREFPVRIAQFPKSSS